jgi:hypothetical protein
MHDALRPKVKTLSQNTILLAQRRQNNAPKADYSFTA